MDAVAKRLINTKCINFNTKQPYVWTSGIESPIYCDNRQINSFPKEREAILEGFLEYIQEKKLNFDIVAGVATGGIPMASFIADRLKKPLIYVRPEPKKHGLEKQIEGYFEKKQKVLLIEDHITTGGSSIKAVETLQKEGINVIKVMSVMSYGIPKTIKLFKEKNIPFKSLALLEDILATSLELGKITKADKETILAFRDSL